MNKHYSFPWNSTSRSIGTIFLWNTHFTLTPITLNILTYETSLRVPRIGSKLLLNHTVKKEFLPHICHNHRTLSLNSKQEVGWKKKGQ